MRGQICTILSSADAGNPTVAGVFRATNSVHTTSSLAVFERERRHTRKSSRCLQQVSADALPMSRVCALPACFVPAFPANSAQVPGRSCWSLQSRQPAARCNGHKNRGCHPSCIYATRCACTRQQQRQQLGVFKMAAALDAHNTSPFSSLPFFPFRKRRQTYDHALPLTFLTLLPQVAIESTREKKGM